MRVAAVLLVALVVPLALSGCLRKFIDDGRPDAPGATATGTAATSLTSTAPPVDPCKEGSDVPVDGRPRRLPAWQPPPDATPASGGFLYLDSDATDFVGEGAKLLYRQSCLRFAVSQVDRILRFAIDGDIDWDLQVQPPAGSARLEAGTYENVTGPHDTQGAGIEVHSHHLCGGAGLRATFIVDEVAYDAYDGPTALTLRFEQHCGGSASALLGKLHWLA